MTINSENKLTDWTPGVRVKVAQINATYPDLVWGTYPGHDPSEDRATDGLVPHWDTKAGNARGWAVAKALWVDRIKLGIWYIIFDGKIISMTRPEKGWITYYPPASAIKRSSASAYHRNHVHVSFYVLSAPATYLPPYVVDPAKVTTSLQGLDATTGDLKFERKPGFRITTGVAIDDKWGRKWLRTHANTLYALEFLALESEYLARPPVTAPPVTPEVPVVPLTKIRAAQFNILGDAAGIKGGEGPLASRLDRIVSAVKESKATVLMLQECNRDAAALVQDALGAQWVWDRQGARVVMARKDVWTMGEGRVRTLPTPYSKADKSYPLTPLTHKNGDVVWFASLHLSATSPYLAIATAAEMEQERTLQVKTFIKDMADYHWLVGGWDGNSASIAAGKPKRLLQDAGFSLLTQDQDFDSADVDSFPNSTPGGQQIDELFCKGGLSIVDGAIIDAHGGSDHRLMWADLTIDKR